jgi:hypothetical protein
VLREDTKPPKELVWSWKAFDYLMDDADGRCCVKQRVPIRRARAVMPFITAARKAGAGTLGEVAQAMQARGVRTPSGGTSWHPSTVQHVERMAA